MPAAMKDGIEFFISSNNVILTEGDKGLLPIKYFKKVTELKTGKLLLGK
jgi:RNA:NAD 2'-phosphotransferase (TPT1/KptA family)